jgi:hypothetical protein
MIMLRTSMLESQWHLIESLSGRGIELALYYSMAHRASGFHFQAELLVAVPISQ